jgi:hypothetical protein
MGYIVSWIFYILVVVLKEHQDRRQLYPSACYNTDLLVARGQAVFSLLLEESPKKEEFSNQKPETITKDRFNELCKTVNPNSQSPNRIISLNNPGTIKDLLKVNCIDNISYYMERVFLVPQFLEPEHTRL